MFQWLILHSAVTAALAVVVLAASRCFRLGPAARHLFWLIVLIKFLTPPVVYWPWALPTLGQAPAVTATAWRAGSVSDRSSAPSRNGTPVAYAPGSPNIIETPRDIGPEPERTEAPAVEERPAAPPFSWVWLPMAASWTWLAGGVLITMRQAVRILGWRRRLRRGASASDGLETLTRDLAGAMGVREPRVVVLSCVASPMVWCFGFPRLLWPSGLEDRLSTEGCRAVLLHELAHLRRRDHWVGWLVLIGGCVWWWHPLFWWLRRRLGQEAELACDAWVVAAAPAARRAYAEALLEVSQRMSAAVAVPALGAAGGRRDLERRLVMIMRGPARSRLSWVGLAGAIALGLLALPAWTLGEDKTPPQPAVTTPPTISKEIPLTPHVNEVLREQKTVPTVLGPTLFHKGDNIEIIDVQATSPKLEPGDSLTVHFRYRLASHDQAQLGLYLTRTESGGSEGLDPSRPIQVKRGEAEMKFLTTIKHRGALHLTLYDKSGYPFSGVYFGTYAQMERIKNWSLNYYLDSHSTPAGGQPAEPVPPVADPVESGAEVINLTRVAYKLKPAMVKALSTLLQDQKDPVLETKGDGESLVVTTTPQAQRIVETFILMLKGLKVEAAPKNRSGEEVIFLTRGSYKLKPVAAETLAKLLRENMKPELLEIRSEGETLVITTIPDAQEAIGQFIHLLPGLSVKPSPKNPVAPAGAQPEGASNLLAPRFEVVEPIRLSPDALKPVKLVKPQVSPLGDYPFQQNR